MEPTTADLIARAVLVTIAKAILCVCAGVVLAVGQQVFVMLREGRPVVSVWPDEEDSE